MPKLSRTIRLFGICAMTSIGIGLLPGCASEPTSDSQRDVLSSQSKDTVSMMENNDPSLKDFMANAYGYVVFPSVGKGGLIIGGSHGQGEAYEQGRMVGWASISQATIGAQAGGQTFSELIVFENQDSFNRFKMNKLTFAANASAVALKSGAGASARYTNGVAVFTKPLGGLMFEAAIGGQELKFNPM